MSGRSRSYNGGSTSRFDPIYTESRCVEAFAGGAAEKVGEFWCFSVKGMYLVCRNELDTVN